MTKNVVTAFGLPAIITAVSIDSQNPILVRNESESEIEVIAPLKETQILKARGQGCDPESPEPIWPKEKKQRQHVCEDPEWHSRNALGDPKSCYFDGYGPSIAFGLAAWKGGTPAPGTGSRRRRCFSLIILNPEPRITKRPPFHSDE